MFFLREEAVAPHVIGRLPRFMRLSPRERLRYMGAPR